MFVDVRAELKGQYHLTLHPTSSHPWSGGHLPPSSSNHQQQEGCFTHEANRGSSQDSYIIHATES